MQTSSLNKNSTIVLITVAATLGGFLFGFDTAVVSGTISSVKKQFSLSSLMEGWFVSSALLGCIIGVGVSGSLGNNLGRKKVMMMAAFLFALSSIGCASSQSAIALVVSRLVGGIGIGIASVICPMYVSELVPANVRGRMVAYYQLAITVGILAAYFSNVYLQYYASIISLEEGWIKAAFINELWRGMFLVGLLPAALFLFTTVFIPESPRWLLLQGDKAKANKILQKVFTSQQMKNEVLAIQNSFDNKSNKNNKESIFKGNKTILLIGLLLPALSQFSGINAIIYYGPSIFERAGFQLSQALGGQVTIGMVNMICTFIAIYIIDRYGRKPLLLWGIGGAVVALLATSILFATNHTNGFLLIITILSFIACFAFSFGPVTWVIINEIFPTENRSKGVAIATMSLWLANWLVGQFFPYLLEQVGPAISFLVFALFSAAAFILTWKKIPETKGKSLEAIHTALI